MTTLASVINSLIGTNLGPNVPVSSRSNRGKTLPQRRNTGSARTRLSTVDMKKQARFISNINLMTKKNNTLLNSVSEGMKKINEKVNTLSRYVRKIDKNVTEKIVSPKEVPGAIKPGISKQTSKNVTEIKNYTRRMVELLTMNNDKLKERESNEDLMTAMQKFFLSAGTNIRSTDLDDKKDKEDKNKQSSVLESLTKFLTTGLGTAAFLTTAGAVSGSFLDKSGSGQLVKAASTVLQPGGIKETVGAVAKTSKNIASFFNKGESKLAQVVEKEAIEEATKLAEKGIMKTVLSKTGKILGKKIPLLGVGVAGKFAADRAREGDYWGAGLELASGITAIIPGLGTAASLIFDAILVAKDLSGNSKIISENQKISSRNSQIAAEITRDAISKAKEGTVSGDYATYVKTQSDAVIAGKEYSEKQKLFDSQKGEYDPTLMARLEKTLGSAKTKDEVFEKSLTLSKSEKEFAESSGLIDKVSSYKALNDLNERLLSMEESNSGLKDMYSADLKARNNNQADEENSKLLDDSKQVLSDYIKFFSQYKIENKEMIRGSGPGGVEHYMKPVVIEKDTGKEIDNESLLNEGLSLKKNKEYTLNDKKTELLLQKYNPDLIKLATLVSGGAKTDYMDLKKTLNIAMQSKSASTYAQPTPRINDNDVLPSASKKYVTSKIIDLNNKPQEKSGSGGPVMVQNINNAVSNSPTLLTPNTIAEPRPWWLYGGNKVSFNQ